MLQTIKTPDQPFWSTVLVDPIVNSSDTWRGSIRNRRVSNLQQPSVSDVARLYPEAVVASSDALAWQNIRLIHLRHSLNEMVIPPSDSHCLVLNLGRPLFVNAQFDKRKFAGEVRAGEVAIIPADSSWVCRSQSSHFSTMMLLYLRPLFVRS